MTTPPEAGDRTTQQDWKLTAAQAIAEQLNASMRKVWQGTSVAVSSSWEPALAADFKTNTELALAIIAQHAPSVAGDATGLREALEMAINTVECDSLDKDGNPLPWYRAAKKALSFTADAGPGAAMITAERLAHISREGWTLAHDDQHTAGELAKNAAILAANGTDMRIEDAADGPDWGLTRHTRIRQLVIAGSLCAAEIDRLKRSTPALATPPVTPERTVAEFATVAAPETKGATPETDKAIEFKRDSDLPSVRYPVVGAHVARRLERERDESIDNAARIMAANHRQIGVIQGMREQLATERACVAEQSLTIMQLRIEVGTLQGAQEYWKQLEADLRGQIELAKDERDSWKTEAQLLRVASDKRIDAFLQEKVCCNGEECGCGGVTRLQQMVGEEAGEMATELRAQLETAQRQITWLQEQKQKWLNSVIEASVALPNVGEYIRQAEAQLTAIQAARDALATIVAQWKGTLENAKADVHNLGGCGEALRIPVANTALVRLNEALALTPAAVSDRIAEAEKQAKFAWERHAEKDRAYGDALADRDRLAAELEAISPAMRELSQYVPQKLISAALAVFESDVSPELAAIAVAIYQIKTSLDDAAQFAHDDERHFKAEEFESRASRYGAMLSFTLKEWDVEEVEFVKAIEAARAQTNDEGKK